MRFRLVVVVVLGALLSGCSGDDGPSGPDTIVHDLWIGGAYFYIPGSRANGITTGAVVFVRDGGEYGAIVSGLTVKINDQELAYDSSQGFYYGEAPTIASGEFGTISVSDGLGTVSQAVQVPFAPSNLEIDGGAWDITDAWTQNRVTWQNPVMVGQGTAWYVYDVVGDQATLLYYNLGTSHQTSFTCYNYDLAYFETITSIGCVVFQGNYAEFLDNPSGSAVLMLTGVAADWSVTP